MIQEQDIQKAFDKYAHELNEPFQLKGIFFDMDGVLYNSMPLHAKSWIQTFAEFGLTLPEIEPYMNEGSTAFFTVQRMFKKYLNQEASNEICEQIKNRKHQVMSEMPKPDVLQPMPKLLKFISSQNIDCWVVTGSAQKALTHRLVEEFQHSLQLNKILTAHDVKHGKPHPEPYLNAMNKSGYRKHSSIVVENAPLGVQSAKAAGLFTIAVNTGPLTSTILSEAGADIVLSGCEELNALWPTFYKIFNRN
ncbi:MAG: HAD family hydrolase [Prolixibacteraceae bacterium]